MTTKPNSEIEALMGDGPAPLVTEGEIAAAKAKAAELVREAQRDAEIKRIIDEETLRIKRAEGQRTGVVDKDEEVDLMIDLPEFCNKITINFLDYWHGASYRVPRHVADGLREIMQRTHQHQAEIDGKSLTERYRRTAPLELSPTGVRPVEAAA